jgi:FtsZ-interacting cell division protein YlmF
VKTRLNQKIDDLVTPQNTQKEEEKEELKKLRSFQKDEKLNYIQSSLVNIQRYLKKESAKRLIDFLTSVKKERIR